MAQALGKVTEQRARRLSHINQSCNPLSQLRMKSAYALSSDDKVRRLKHMFRNEL